MLWRIHLCDEAPAGSAERSSAMDWRKSLSDERIVWTSSGIYRSKAMRRTGNPWRGEAVISVADYTWTRPGQSAVRLKGLVGPPAMASLPLDGGQGTLPDDQNATQGEPNPLDEAGSDPSSQRQQGLTLQCLLEA